MSFPDFPGCITAGRTLDEASRLAAEALALHIQGMIEDGDAVPKPSKVDDIAADAAKRGAIAFLVNVEAPDATVRVNITARESQMAKIDALAEAAGLTRSGYACCHRRCYSRKETHLAHTQRAPCGQVEIVVARARADRQCIP